MKEFFLTDWKELACVLGFIIVTLVTVITNLTGKKVKVYDGIRTFILSILPHFINLIESEGRKPSVEKLKNCLIAVNVAIKQQYPSFEIGSCDEFIVENIERILSTPQKKKEVSYGKR